MLQTQPCLQGSKYASVILDDDIPGYETRYTLVQLCTNDDILVMKLDILSYNFCTIS